MFSKTKTTRQAKPVQVKPTSAVPPLDLPASPPSPVATTPVATSAPAVTPVRSTPSILGPQISINGNVTGAGHLQIDGNVHGDVKVGHLIVGEAGNIEGAVEAETIEIRGRVLGAISGKQVRLMASSYVEGDITHESLSIDIGAYFQGRCLQTRPALAPVAAPPVKPVQIPEPMTAPSSAYDLNALSDLK